MEVEGIAAGEKGDVGAAIALFTRPLLLSRRGPILYTIYVQVRPTHTSKRDPSVVLDWTGMVPGRVPHQSAWRRPGDDPTVGLGSRTGGRATRPPAAGQDCPVESNGLGGVSVASDPVQYRLRARGVGPSR